jgi:ABC-type transport system involved in multi-copper enzyme maturation permease subunit
MSFLPVVGRELRVTARNSRLYWGRLAAALIATTVIAWLWLMNSAGRATSSELAKLSFEVLSWMAFIFSLILGVFLTADCISEEKREGTLGLLFLTNLKGYDVALGKLAAISLRALYSLTSIFPVLTIPLLLGGLTGQEIFRVALVLLVTMIFSLTIGLFISSVSRNDRRAQFGALGVMALVTLGLPLLLRFLRSEVPYGAALDEFMAVSPGYAFHFAFQSRYLGNEVSFWRSIIVVHALSWIAFFLAAVIVRRIWQDRPAVGIGGGWWKTFMAWKLGSPEKRKHYRNTLLGVNAYYWLAARDRLKPYYVGGFLAACGAFWTILWLYNRSDMLEQEAFFVCAVLLHTAMKVWVAAEAGRQFAEDRRNSALELTLSTPLPVRDILEGQFLGLLRQFGIPIAVILVFDVTGMIVGARMRLGSDSESVLMWVAMMIVFIVDAVTIAIVGMWLGLVVRRSSRAIAQNLFFVIGVPWLILIGFVTYISLVPVHRSSMESTEFLIGAYFLVSIGTDLFLFLSASGNLTNRFRDAATQRFQSGKGQISEG